MEKSIKDFEDYSITDSGKVISYKYKQPRIMKTWFQKSGYENIKLCKQNCTTHKLIHRLVAEAFIPNPMNLPEVNHKSKNKADNRVENLEWCTRLNNLYDSYITMSPVRNFIEVDLINIETGEILGSFQSKIAAARYANEKYGCSISGMQKYGKVGKYSITCRD